MKRGSPSKVMQFLILHDNKAILCAQHTLWACLALAAGRLDTLMCLITPVLIYWLFLWSPFTAPWHRLLARACAGSLPGTRLAPRCSRLPGLPARPWPQSPLLPALLPVQPPAASAQDLSSSFSCWGIDVQEILSSELFSLLLNDRLFCSPDHSDSSMCTFSKGSWVCQRSNRKLRVLNAFGYNQDPKSINNLHSFLCQSYLLHLVFSSVS